MKKQSNRHWRILSSALAAALMISLVPGCGSQPAPGASGASSSGGASTPSAAPAPAAPKEADGKKVIRYSFNGQDAKTYDPTQFTGDVDFAPQVFESLIEFSNDLEYQGELAESWDVSDDGLTYTFHLRKGVQFHQGYGEMKASDVLFTFNRIKDPDIDGSQLATNIEYDNIAKMEAPDDYTFVITLKQPLLLFEFYMSNTPVYIISEKAVKKLGNEEFGKRPVGTGPFEFTSGVRGQKTVMTRFEDYWGEKAKADRLEMMCIQEPATLFNAFETGELDIFNIADTNKMLEYIEQPDKYTLSATPSLNQGYFGLNVSVAPFDDIRVRQACFLAINREELLNDYFQGLESGPTSILPANARYSATGTFNAEYNPEKAKQLLAEAGYPNGLDTVLYTPNDQLCQGPATIIQTYLTAVGIRCELQAIDFGIFLETVRAGKCPIWLIYDGCGIEPDTYMKRWTTETADNFPSKNYCQWRNADYDQYVAAAMSSRDPAVREENFKKAQQVMTDDFIIYPFATYNWVQVMHNYVTGFEMPRTLVALFNTIDKNV